MKNSSVLVLGGSGFLGFHLVFLLKKKGYEVVTPRSKEYDLREQADVRKMFRDFHSDVVINLSAICGGIGFNQNYPGKLFYDNAIMGIMTIHEAQLSGIKKFVQIGTICAYPKITEIPFKEENLWNGFPESTNAPYGLAKKMLLVQAQAYRKQYGFNAIYLLPVNLYGPNDHFEEEKSHVIPALIKKFVDAKEKQEKEVVVWGTGNPTREFLYVEDAARGIVMAMERYDGEEPVNLGANKEISIHDLAYIIKEKVGYDGKIVFDPSKPDGQPRRKLDTTRAKELFGFEATTDFDEGLEKTIKWYNNFRTGGGEL
jgi:GDP-L-fucose synthase